jgi:hypothetical protein
LIDSPNEERDGYFEVNLHEEEKMVSKFKRKCVKFNLEGADNNRYDDDNKEVDYLQLTLPASDAPATTAAEPRSILKFAQDQLQELEHENIVKKLTASETLPPTKTELGTTQQKHTEQVTLHNQHKEQLRSVQGTNHLLNSNLYSEEELPNPISFLLWILLTVFLSILGAVASSRSPKYVVRVMDLDRLQKYVIYRRRLQKMLHQHQVERKSVTTAKKGATFCNVKKGQDLTRGEDQPRLGSDFYFETEEEILDLEREYWNLLDYTGHTDTKSQNHQQNQNSRIHHDHGKHDRHHHHHHRHYVIIKQVKTAKVTSNPTETQSPPCCQITPPSPTSPSVTTTSPSHHFDTTSNHVNDTTTSINTKASKDSECQYRFYIYTSHSSAMEDYYFFSWDGSQKVLMGENWEVLDHSGPRKGNQHGSSKGGDAGKGFGVLEKVKEMEGFWRQEKGGLC